MRWLAVLSLVLVSSVAVAQPPPAEPEVVYQKRTVLNLEGTQVDGGVVGPNGTLVTARAPSRGKSLLLVRKSFRPELLLSVHDL
jgi:hypothetical protein